MRHFLQLFVVILCSLTIQGQTTHDVPLAFPTIQAAIVAANTGDTVLVAPGTYFETIDFLGDISDDRVLDRVWGWIR